jgi:hypothetical protein
MSDTIWDAMKQQKEYEKQLADRLAEKDNQILAINNILEAIVTNQTSSGAR